MAMKRKYEIEEEISRLQDEFNDSSRFISEGLLHGRTDLGIVIENRSNLRAKMKALCWVINQPPPTTNGK